ncbi:MAG: sigma-70 family RNA polymerase sigma factor [Novosphingobium sp.]
MQAGEDQLKAWMAQGLDGDAASHTALLRATAPLLRAFYRRRVGDGDTIEDLVQETLIAIHTRRMSYDRDRSFSAWLFAVARYKMIDHFRRTRQTCPIEEIDHLFSDGFEDETNARMDINRLLAALPEKQGQAIRQTRIEGHSIGDAARHAGIGESDVKISVHRGLKALAMRIRGERP